MPKRNEPIRSLLAMLPLVLLAVGCNYPMVCYEVANPPVLDPPAFRNLKTQFGLEQEVEIANLKYVCENARKAHSQDALPQAPPRYGPVTCYEIQGDPADVAVHLQDDNDLFGGDVQVGGPVLFCDPVEQKLIEGEVQSGSKYPSQFKLYRLGPQNVDHTLWIRDQFGPRVLGLDFVDLLMEPATKAEGETPGDPSRWIEPRTCFRLAEGAEPLNIPIQLVDQFGDWQVTLTAPRWFCEPTKKDHL